MNPPERRVDWYRVPIHTEVLRRLSEPCDAKGLIQAGGHLLLCVLTGLFAFQVSQTLAWYWLIPALLLHGTVTNHLTAGVHELSHGRVFRTDWLNRTFLYALSFFTWMNPRIYWISHNEHHKHTLHPPDDLEVVLPQKMNWFEVLSWAFIDVNDFYQKFIKGSVFRSALGRPTGGWEAKLLTGIDKPTRRWVHNWTRWQLLGHGLIAAVSLYHGLWIIPVLTTLPVFYGGWLIMLVGWPQHAGMADNVNDFRLCCRTFYLNPLCRFLYWNMNYHIEHHMYPAVPCYNLPRLHRAIRHELPRSPDGLIETWIQIGSILIRQRYEPSYQYRPQLPTDAPTAPARPSQDDSVPTPAPGPRLKVWECSLCGFIYDETDGLPEEGLPPGTRWEDIPDDWHCPVCGVSKARFQMVEIMREAATSKPRRDIEDVAD